MTETHSEIIYKIIVITHDSFKGNITGNVFLQLFGKRKVQFKKVKKTEAWSTKFPLERSKKKKSRFLNENINEFEITEVDVGHIEKVCISGNEISRKGVNTIMIEIPSKGKYWKFKNNAKKGKKFIEQNYAEFQNITFYLRYFKSK